MDFPLLSIVLDILLVGLLAAAILYGLRLNKHLKALRQSREELKKLLEEFGSSTERAENALEALRRGSRENIGAVKKTADKAESLKDDLEFLSKRGEQIADRLEAAVSAGRKAGGMPAPASEAGENETRSLSADPRLSERGEDGRENRKRGGKERGKAKSKSDLLRALQGMR